MYENRFCLYTPVSLTVSNNYKLNQKAVFVKIPGGGVKKNQTE